MIDLEPDNTPDDVRRDFAGRPIKLRWWIFNIIPVGPLTYFAFSMAVGLPMIAVYRFFYPPMPFQIPHIQAEPYIWPAGCEKREYQYHDRISPKCADSRYYLGDGMEYGWKHGLKGSTEYYRVDNDAIFIICPVFRDTCSVTKIYRSVFFQ